MTDCDSFLIGPFLPPLLSPLPQASLHISAGESFVEHASLYSPPFLPKLSVVPHLLNTSRARHWASMVTEVSLR